jgi:predicted neuraminidase
MYTENPEVKDPEWTSPQRIASGVLIQKPTVISGGDWLVPVCDGSDASALVSEDGGKTFYIRGYATLPPQYWAWMEAIFVERRDGSIWMPVRTNTGKIYESISGDRGKTWSEMKPTSILQPAAKFFIRRLASGNLLLVKHGPVNGTITGIEGQPYSGRSHLMAFISKDDGKTWSKGLLLDERPGISYPDGQQTADGRIYIIYDFERTGSQQIVMTSFTEEDILSPDYDQKIIEVFKNRRIISKR